MSKYFNKVLIANRGEISRRIIRSCKNLGIKTVAVFSEADDDAPFVKEADESYCIGPAPVKKSYLNVDSIIQATKVSGAEAIHPGYGFLSENPVFAKRCEQEGITFIGPNSKTIALMGSKVEARRLMQQAGVPIVPGCDEEIASLEEAMETASHIGYPVMLKASAGGGGIGMQLVYNANELKKAFGSTIQRADAFFGDSTIFMEKYIENAHHIEVQVAADHFGNVVHLYERECSVQRRNQKVVEESPSPFLNEEVRSQLCEMAVRGIKSIDYTNLGTMEFIFDNDGHFYFLEMNTRLQVEHPTTEMIIGLDLVELQLRIAAGEELAISQSEIYPHGHAIEARLYAEDPKTYMPSPGVITKLELPTGNIRLDLAIIKGSKVTPFYDPMIGKIISHGRDRNEAIEKLHEAMNQIILEGLTSNLLLLKTIITDPSFKSGNYNTRILETISVPT